MEKDNLRIKIVKGKPTSSDLKILEYLYSKVFEDAQLDFFRNRLNEKENIYSLIAFENDIPLGFKIGYQYNGSTFYSWVGGVLSNHRTKGIGKKLAHLQEQWAKKNNYFKIRTKSMNHFKPMMIFNLKNGFNIVSVYTNASNQTKIVFEKEL